MKRITWLILAGFVLAVAGEIVAKPSTGTNLYPQDFPEKGCPYATIGSYNAPKRAPCYCGIFHIWSPEHNGCVGRVNTSCAFGRLCAFNSFCDPNEWCQCIPEHIATKSRTCIPNSDPSNLQDSKHNTTILVTPTKKPVTASDTVVTNQEVVVRITVYYSSAPSPFFKSSTLVLAIIVFVVVSFV